MKPILHLRLSALAAVILLIGLTGNLPRVGPSTRGEGTERRYFYGTVWAVTVAQTLLLILWKTLPVNPATSWVKLGAYVAALVFMGWLAYQGVLPHRPILRGKHGGRLSRSPRRKHGSRLTTVN